MSSEFEFLVEKEAMWAEMLMQVLENNDIPCVSQPVYGAGFTMRTGVQEWLRIYVPAEALLQATDLMNILFSPESIVKEDWQIE